MANVKIGCPNCSSTGLTGEVNVAVCKQCTGTGTVTAQETDTIATVSAAQAAVGSPLVVTVPKTVPTAAAKVVIKGK